MALVILQGFEARVRRQIKADQDYITLTSGDAKRLNDVGSGNHTYFVVADAMRFEVMRYDHTDDWGTGHSYYKVPVTRGISDDGPQNFAAYSCLRTNLVETVVRELVNDMTDGRFADLEQRVTDLENP